MFRMLAPLKILTEFILTGFISLKGPHIGSKLTLQHNAGYDVGTGHNMLFSFAVKLLACLNFLEFSEHLNPKLDILHSTE